MAKGTFIQEPGSGVSAMVDGACVSVGTLEWLSRQGMKGADATSAERMMASSSDLNISESLFSSSTGLGSSHTRVYVGIDGKLVGSIDVQVRLR
jgi:cation transport ATPase